MDKKILYPILLKNFLIVCKEHKFYRDIKKQWIRDFNSTNTNEKITSCVPFFNGNLVLNKVLNMADKIIDEMSHKQRRDGSDYEYVMIATNSLLHLFLECKDYCNHDIIPQLGEEIFNRTCYQLFGNKFLEDMKKFKEENRHKRKDVMSPHNLGSLLSELVSKYHVNINRIVDKHRNIEGNIQWDELNAYLTSLYNSLKVKECVGEEMCDFEFEDDSF